MINWLVIFILLIIGFVVIRFSHAEKKIKLVVFVIIILLIYVSATSLLKKNNVSLDSVDGVGKAVSLYFSWIGHTVKGVWDAGGQVKTTVGNAVKTNLTQVIK